MKISKEKLWDSIFKVSPWMKPVKGEVSLPEALYKSCVDIVIYSESYTNRTNFDYSTAVLYIKTAIRELKEMGFLSFPQEQN